MSDLTLFTFDDHALRITDRNGAPWFVLKDVLAALRTTRTTAQAITSINQNLGKGYTNDIPLSTKGGTQSTAIAAEPAVTFLVSRSNTEDGRRLNRFIHTEVLPALRQTGGYHLNPQPPAPSPAPVTAPAPRDPTRLLSLARYVELLEAENALLQHRLTPPAPVVPAPRRSAHPSPRPVSAAEAATVLALFNAGQAKEAIARVVGRHSRTVGRIIARATDPVREALP